jgi:peptidoglycan/LPS O-acetylase OafA/YrhL
MSQQAAVSTADDAPGIPAPSPLRNVPALDGLRGLSLPGTIFTHFAIFFIIYLPDKPRWLKQAGPFTLNIEMFFVLSGALITSLLVSERQRKGRVSLVSFYKRRSRRLGPALLAVVPLLLLAHFTLEHNGQLDPLGATPWITAASLLLFVGNWRLSENEAGLGWMGPAWTLGIEEQFYLTWPALLLLMLRRFRAWAILLAVALIVAGSIAFSAAYSHKVGTSRTGYMTPTHLPPLLLGCALGYWLASFPTGRFAQVLRSQLVAVAGLAGMVWISKEYYADRHFLDAGGYALYGTFACLLIGHLFVVASRPGLISKLFAWKPLVVIGQVSYEAYLVHVIVILATLRMFPTMDAVSMIVLDVVLIAVISGAFYYFIGRPIRRRGWGVVIGRPLPDRGEPRPAEGAVPLPATSAAGSVFGVLALSVVVAAACVAADDAWRAAGTAIAAGAVIAQVVARAVRR